MTKFKRVLSSDDVFDLHEKYDGCVFKVIEAAEQAVLSKLAEQEPVAWTSSKIFGHYVTRDTKATAAEWFKENLDVPLYAHPVPCVSHASDKTACVSEKMKSETQASSQVNLDSLSVPTEEKTVEQHRAEFEAWVASEFKGGFCIKR